MSIQMIDLACRTLQRIIAAGLVLALSFLSSPLAAHPLPASNLEITLGATELELHISMPLGELALAFPAVATLGDSPPDGPLPAALTDKVAQYLAVHLRLAPADGAATPASLKQARIVGAFHEDLGNYKLLVVDLTMQVTEGHMIFPLGLSYDVIMHEVRNHRADISLKSAGHAPTLVAQAHFDLSTGKVAPIELRAP